MTTDSSALRALAHDLGVSTRYWGWDGTEKDVADSTLHAILAALGVEVHTVERIGELLRIARKRFRSLGLNVRSKHDDGRVGWPEEAPFDGILVTAGAPALVDALTAQLAPGGVLLYATCSILADENARQVDAFLARHADVVAEPLDDRYGRATGGGRQRLPGDGGMDGFFYARIAKRGRR